MFEVNIVGKYPNDVRKLLEFNPVPTLDYLSFQDGDWSTSVSLTFLFLSII